MDIINELYQDQLRSDLPTLNTGDVVDVHYRVVEGDKERIQVFTGTVIAINGSDISRTFTVRKIAAGGIGVERIFPYNSPLIAEIKISRQSKVRRSKLYYLRDRRGKAARLKEKTAV
ncbi:50S ribosomal protein L19 [Calditrichota bacterium]